jgi:hypothetical protein
LIFIVLMLTETILVTGATGHKACRRFEGGAHSGKVCIAIVLE